jgi:hypothetical protein
MIVDETLKNIVDKTKEKIEKKEAVPGYPTTENLGSDE